MGMVLLLLLIGLWERVNYSVNFKGSWLAEISLAIGSVFALVFSAVVGKREDVWSCAWKSCSCSCRSRWCAASQRLHKLCPQTLKTNTSLKENIFVVITIWNQINMLFTINSNFYIPKFLQVQNNSHYNYY